MKICFFTSYYPPFLDSFYKHHPEFFEMSFSGMQNLLLSKMFADTGAAYHYTLKKGNDAFLIIETCEPLQKQWAKENNIEYNNENWKMKIAFEQIKKYSPDIFYIESVFEYFGEFIKSVSPYCKKIASFISTPLPVGLNLNGIHFILSSTPDFVKKFSELGIKSGYIHPAFDQRVLSQINIEKNKSIPFSFVGGWSEVHPIRKNALKELVAKTPIQIWGYGYKEQINIKGLKYFTNEYSKILKRYKGECWGLEMYNILQQSFVTFNIHESLLKGNVGNMRMFEASGVGTMILNDAGSNLAAMFEPGKEIETYTNINEAIEKLNFYLNNKEKAIEIGKNAMKRTCKDYNYDIYIDEVLKHFNSLLK